MTKRLNLKFVLSTLVALIVATVLSSCSKDVLRPNELSGDKLVAGRLDGTWAIPSSIVTPENVPAEVFGNMRLVFTTEDFGTPSKFMAQDCPIVFGNTTSGTWNVSGTEDSAKVSLVGITPVDDFKAKVTSNTLTISFYMGWENTETKQTGKGNFSVTLTRQ